MGEELSKRIDDVHKRFDDLRGDMNRRFEEVNRRIDEVVIELRELRADMQSHFRWTVTTMVALFGLAVPVWMWFLSLILKLR
ncbi:MAG: hypothetical protein HY724_07230 [Candidatus Rokubacteria bacterium]|nr:hypothetical protein [Candidatus Rokubacteria bacterium]